MIDYEYLCQAIEDWKAGRRPSAPPPPQDAVQANAGEDVEDMDVEAVDEVDSGLVMVDASTPSNDEAAAAIYEGHDEPTEAAPPLEDGNGYADHDEHYQHDYERGRYDDGDYGGQAYLDPASTEPGYAAYPQGHEGYQEQVSSNVQSPEAYDRTMAYVPGATEDEPQQS